MPGRVIQSTPPGGEEVECQSTVTLVVSKGPNLITLPDVLGQSQEAAEAELERLGFIVDVDTRDADEPEGTVIGQDPGPGSELLRGDRVTIIVSTGAGSVIVPSVVGQSRGRRDRHAHGPRASTSTSSSRRPTRRARTAGCSTRRRLRAPACVGGDTVTIFVGGVRGAGRDRAAERTTTTTTTDEEHAVRVAVIRGGRSSEHEISLQSGASVAEGLRDAGHDVIEVLIDRDGRWLADGEEVEMRAAGGLLGCDVAFPVLHGPFGEDGTVQGLLESLDVAYAGPSVLAAAVAMDKLICKRLLAFDGLPQVEFARGRRGRLARARRGDAAAAVGEAVAARLERRDTRGLEPRARARPGGRARRAPTTRG